MADQFFGRRFNMKFQESNDQIVVRKLSNSDRVGISIVTNGFDNGEIVIRGRAMLEQLHFTLGQLLKEDV